MRNKTPEDMRAESTQPMNAIPLKLSAIVNFQPDRPTEASAFFQKRYGIDGAEFIEDDILYCETKMHGKMPCMVITRPDNGQIIDMVVPALEKEINGFDIETEEGKAAILRASSQRYLDKLKLDYLDSVNTRTVSLNLRAVSTISPSYEMKTIEMIEFIRSEMHHVMNIIIFSEEMGLEQDTELMNVLNHFVEGYKSKYLSPLAKQAFQEATNSLTDSQIKSLISALNAEFKLDMFLYRGRIEPLENGKHIFEPTLDLGSGIFGYDHENGIILDSADRDYLTETLKPYRNNLLPKRIWDIHYELYQEERQKAYEAFLQDKKEELRQQIRDMGLDPDIFKLAFNDKGDLAITSAENDDLLSTPAEISLESLVKMRKKYEQFSNEIIGILDKMPKDPATNQFVPAVVEEAEALRFQLELAVQYNLHALVSIFIVAHKLNEPILPNEILDFFDVFTPNTKVKTNKELFEEKGRVHEFINNRPKQDIKLLLSILHEQNNLIHLLFDGRITPLSNSLFAYEPVKTSTDDDFEFDTTKSYIIKRNDYAYLGKELRRFSNTVLPKALWPIFHEWIKENKGLTTPVLTQKEEVEQASQEIESGNITINIPDDQSSVILPPILSGTFREATDQSTPISIFMDLYEPVTIEAQTPASEEVEEEKTVTIVEVSDLLPDGEIEKTGISFGKIRHFDSEREIRYEPRRQWIINALLEAGFEYDDLAIYSKPANEVENDLNPYFVIEAQKEDHYFQIAVCDTVGNATFIIRNPIDFSHETEKNKTTKAELKSRRDVFQIPCFNQDQFIRSMEYFSFTPFEELQEQLKTRVGWFNKKEAVLNWMGNHYLENGSIPQTRDTTIIELECGGKMERATIARLYGALQNKLIHGLEHVQNLWQLAEEALGPDIFGERQEEVFLDAKDIFRRAAHHIRDYNEIPQDPLIDRSFHKKKVRGLEEFGIVASIATAEEFFVATGLAVANENKQIEPVPQPVIQQFIRLLG